MSKPTRASEAALENLLGSETLSAQELGLLCDEFWAVKTDRLAQDKIAKTLKTAEDALQAKLIEQFLRQGISASGGKTIILTMPAPKEEPVVQDWQAFWQFIKSQDDMSLFEKRPGRAAIKERWASGESIPGVGKFPVYTLSKQGVK
jgi:hypothetical protein